MSRREEILARAADLFAARGFHGVSMSELGAAVGISGPAIYKHFASKDAMLAEMLVTISDRLLAGGADRLAAADGPADALDRLVAWHVDFAIADRALIVVQDRDWASLTPDARDRVRSTQRRYVDLWAELLRALEPDLGADAARARAHAVFGLINSTPHIGSLPSQELRALLREMALAALGVARPQTRCSNG